MRIQIILAAFLGIAVELISTKKGYNRKAGGIQAVDLDNKAGSQANSFALNCGFLGDANSLAVSDATNFNCVDQKMK